MGLFVTLLIVALAMVVLLATIGEARILLDYDSCYNGVDNSTLNFHMW